MIKLSDYVVKRLEEHGVKDVFLISGGGAMHLNDSFGKSKKIKYYCNHHEQASAIAAEGYSRSSGKLAVVNVTTGPGGTNAITGVIGQWLDSVPVLYISGQVKRQTCVMQYEPMGLRQIGDQEINIVEIVRSVTKFAHMVTDPIEIKKVIDEAIYIATSKRPGPCWIDIPLDVQGALIEESSLEEFIIPKEEKTVIPEIQTVISILKDAKRPVIVAGNGIRIGNAKNAFLKLIEELQLPVVMTFCGYDLIPTEHPLNIGRMGTVGDRAGNFAVTNADVYLSIGSRNNIRQISYNWESVARHAKKIIVDIDPSELVKPTIKPDLAINADASDFISQLYNAAINEKFPDRYEWVAWCQERKKRYPVVLPEYKDVKENVQPYYFIDMLTEKLKSDAIVVAGNGSCCVTLFQAGLVKDNSRFFWNSGCAAMGYDLSSAIGAAIAEPKRQTICIAGDGSLMMNIQELSTVSYYNLPIKIFVLNNNGYISIKQTQNNFFDGHLVASDPSTGVGIPDFVKVGSAFGIKSFRISSHNDMSKGIDEVLSFDGPMLCEVMLLTDYSFSPKLSSEKKPDGQIISKPIEDMWPFLPRDEYFDNMLVEQWKK